MFYSSGQPTALSNLGRPTSLILISNDKAAPFLYGFSFLRLNGNRTTFVKGIFYRWLIVLSLEKVYSTYQKNYRFKIHTQCQYYSEEALKKTIATAMKKNLQNSVPNQYRVKFIREDPIASQYKTKSKQYHCRHALEYQPAYRLTKERENWREKPAKASVP